MPHGKLLFAPSHAATFDVPSTELVSLWRLPTAAPGPGPHGSLGSDVMPPHYDANRYTKSAVELTDALVDLIEPFGARSSGAGDLMRTTLAIYDAIAGPIGYPLIRNAAPDFFLWLESARTP
ncbi:MAG: hypothetical protein AB7S26_19305 [Sandaracinaceae bacterium]